MTTKTHGPIREDVGGYYCGTCGLPCEKRDEACAGPPPMPLSSYDLSQVKNLLEALVQSGNTRYAHLLQRINEHLDWRGCAWRLGLSQSADYWFQTEALGEIKDSILESFDVPHAKLEKWETSDDRPWSATIFFKDAAKQEPRTLNYILHFQEAQKWKEQEIEAFLTTRIAAELGYEVEVCVAATRNTRGHAYFIARKTESVAS